MVAARYLLAVLSVLCLGIAAGAFYHHAPTNPSYAVPALLAALGVVAGLAAWKLDWIWRGRK